MPHPSDTQDIPSQNGYYPKKSVLSEDLSDLKNSTLNPTLTQSNPPISDEWSSLTKDLLNTLPRVWTRGLLYFLVIFAAIILPWAMLSKVDETGSARGRLEPKGATQRLDFPTSGTVTAVKVKEGQTVKAGQVLIELESDVLRNDLQQSQTKLESQFNRQAQLELLKNQLLIAIRAQEQQNQAQELEKLAQVNQAQQNLDSKQAAYNLQKVEKLTQVDQARQNFYSSQAAYNLANSRLNRDSTEVQRYRQLFQKGAVPEIKVVEMEKLAQESQRLRVQAQSDIKQALLRLQEELSRYQTIIYNTQSDIKQAKLRIEEQQGSYQSLIHGGKLAVLKSEEQLNELQTQITTLKAEISQTETQINSLEFQLQERVLRSPIDGMLFQLPIQRSGVVVQPGQMIAQIAPKGAALMFKAQMPISESGFLHIRMPVKLKFDAYPFQDYGIVSGHLHWISPDSKVLDLPQGKVEVFELEIALDKTYIQNQNKQINLTSGQTATAEVIIRQRRVIDFIIDPFKKLQKGGLEL